jgi:hypothetical protein
LTALFSTLMPSEPLPDTTLCNTVVRSALNSSIPPRFGMDQGPRDVGADEVALDSVIVGPRVVDGHALEHVA